MVQEMLAHLKRLPFNIREKKMELVLQIFDIPLLIFGNQITSIFAQKSFPFNVRQNIGMYYVLQISIITSLILVTMLSLRLLQKDGALLHFRK